MRSSAFPSICHDGAPSIPMTGAPSWFSRKRAMLKLSVCSVVAVAFFTVPHLAMAQTPGTAPAAKPRPAPLLKAEDVPLRASRAERAHALSTPLARQSKPSSLAGKPSQHSAARSQTNAGSRPTTAQRLATLTMPNRPQRAITPSRPANASSVSFRSKTLTHLPSSRLTRSAYASSFTALPRRGARRLYARTAAVQAKAMSKLPSRAKPQKASRAPT